MYQMYANVNESTVLYLKSYRCMGLQGGYAREVCKGVCNGCAMGVQWVCNGCARGVTLPQVGRNFGVALDNILLRFWFIVLRGRHVVNRCLGLFIQVF